MDSACYAAAVIAAIGRNGARFSVTGPVTPAIRAAIAGIPEQSWTPIRYPQAAWDRPAGLLDLRRRARRDHLHRVHLQEQSPARHRRLIVRRVRDKGKTAPGQGELFPAWRYHAVFTDSPCELVQAEEQHRGHAIIELLLADLNDGPLAHLPSGKFSANAAWLAIAAIAHNLARAAGALAGRRHARARTATIRRDLVAVAARTARHGRGLLTLHLPHGWHRERRMAEPLRGRQRPARRSGLTSPDPVRHRTPARAPRPQYPLSQDPGQAAEPSAGGETPPRLIPCLSSALPSRSTGAATQLNVAEKTGQELVILNCDNLLIAMRKYYDRGG